MRASCCQKAHQETNSDKKATKTVFMLYCSEVSSSRLLQLPLVALDGLILLLACTS